MRSHAFALLGLLTALAMPTAPALAQERSARQGDAPRRSVIYFIGDGMGHPQVTLGRFGALERGVPYALDRFQVVGQSSTRSADYPVTDSAASGTALATGVKTNNQVIGLDAQGRRCQTILEAAHEAGLMTGLVTTTRITHATPAAFAAHVKHRKDEGDIAEQLAARDFPEVLIGGGSRYFPAPLRERMAAHGFTLVEDPQALAGAKPGMQGGRPRLAALLAKSHIPYRVDGGSRATLLAMTQKAVEVLAAGGPFFLMVEGGRVDHACHVHDAVGALHEQLELSDAVGWALDRAERDPNLLVVVTADHATGNLGVSERLDIRGLLAAKASSEALADASGDLSQEAGREAFQRAVLEAYGLRLDDQQLARIGRNAGNKYWVSAALGHLASAHYGVYWYELEMQEEQLTNTHGHDGAHVPVYAFGPEAERFAGTYENIEIPRRIAAILDLSAGVEPGSPLGSSAAPTPRRPSYFK